MEMQISPVSPGSHSVPSSRRIATSYSGTGLPIEPGRGVVLVRLPMVSGVSVWPKPSKMVRPVWSFQNWNRSGFSASPAVVEYSNVDRS